MCNSKLRGRQRHGAIWLVVAAVALGGCALHRSQDYVLGISCTVVDGAGAPVSGSDVVLQLDHVAYRGVEAVGEDRQVTSASGGVTFMYLSDRRATPYVVTVRKAGYSAVELRGVAHAGAQGTHLRAVLVPSGAPQE